MALMQGNTDTFPTKNYCFLCGKAINDGVYVFWQGCNGESIALHASCAEYLGINLLRDALTHRAVVAGRC